MIRETSPDPEPPRIQRVAASRLCRWLMLASLSIIVLVAAFEGYRAWKIVDDVRAARSHLRSGQNIIETQRLDATNDDLVWARGEFRAAGASFAGAQSRIEGDHILSALRHLPLVGGQADAAVDLTTIGQQAAIIGQQGVDAADAFNQVRAQPDGTMAEKTMRVFDAADPSMAQIRTRVASVDALRGDIGGRSLLPPMRTAVDELDARRQRLQEFLDTYRRAREFAPDFLGFSGPRTYLVLAQNEAELMPGGGLVSVFGTLRLDKGHIDSLEFHDSVQYGEDWMRRTGDYVEPPTALKQYLLKDTSWNLAVSNWSPDFPTSAQAATRFYQLGGGENVDGVIAIDVRTLERLLAIVGSVYVPDFDVTVDASNAYDLTEQYTRAPYEPQADRKAFAGLLADEVLRRVLHPESGQWSQLVDALQELGDDKDMMIYSSNAKEQDVIRQFGWDGGVSYGSGDYLALVDASINSTKLNAVIQHSADISVQLDATGAATTTVTVDYFNDLAPWANGRDPRLVDQLMLGGMYGGYLRLLTPPGSRIVSVKDASGEIGVEEVGREKNLAVFGRFFALPRDTKQRLQFTYVTPPVAKRDGSVLVYSLALRKQPGWEEDAVTVHVTGPGGEAATSATIDGVPTRWRADQAKVDLSRDRTLTLRF